MRSARSEPAAWTILWGCTQKVEAIVLLQTAGGECVDDIAMLRADKGLMRLVGPLPSPDVLLTFLYAFHDEGLLERAQISSAGLIDFFGRVGALEKKMGAPEWNILRTHPQSAERAKAAAEHNGYPATPAMDADDWQALRAMCGAARLPKPATGGDKL